MLNVFIYSESSGYKYIGNQFPFSNSEHMSSIHADIELSWIELGDEMQ